MAAAARRYQWSSLLDRTAARTGLSRCFPNHHLLLRNSRAPAIMNNLCSNGLASEPSDRWQQQQQQQQQQQRLRNNSFGVAAAAAAGEVKVVSSSAPSLLTSPSPSWSSSSSYPPFLMLPSTDVTSRSKEVNYGAFFNLRDHKVVNLRKYLPEQILDAECKGSSRGWLVYVNRHDCSIYLADLFSSISSISPKIMVLPLPSLLKYELDDGNFGKKHSCFKMCRLSMSSSPINDCADAAADDLINRDCIVMMYPLGGRGLTFCRIGDPAWMPLSATGWPERVDDIIYSKKDKVFYSITVGAVSRKFHVWDFNDTAGDDQNGGFPKRIDFDMDFGEMVYQDYYCYEVSPKVLCAKYYLVELPEGEILHLQRFSIYCNPRWNYFDTDNLPGMEDTFPLRTAFFTAYKLDFEKQIAVPVKSLGDTALFVGFNESFSLSTRDHPNLRPNSIYFADDKHQRIFDDNYYYGGDDIGVYDFENHSVRPLYGPSHFRKIQPPPIWVSSSRP